MSRLISAVAFLAAVVLSITIVWFAGYGGYYVLKAWYYEVSAVKVIAGFWFYPLLWVGLVYCLQTMHIQQRLRRNG